jgi:sialate O-acetylesterase
MKSKLLLISILCILVGVSNTVFSQKLSLPAIFANNMVLQQNTKVNLWGTSEPNDNIKIEASWGKSATAIAGKDGKWSATIETVVAGGPYSLKIKGKSSKITIDNILLGEVWLCSGQSNMEMPLKGFSSKDSILDASKEIAAANYPQIRMFAVARAYSPKPKDNVKGEWMITSPKTVADYSATAYLFGRSLYQQLQVPIGLINTSWGGTPAESWISADLLSIYPEFAKDLDSLDKADEKLKAFNTWIESHPQMPIANNDNAWKNLSFSDFACALATTKDNQWSNMKLPVSWESTSVGTFDGVIWFRKWIDVPESWLKSSDIQIKLPAIDDMDQTFINGVRVGATEMPNYWQTPRTYTVPASALHAGKNLIAIRVLDNSGGGGIWNAKDTMQLINYSLKENIDLTGDWKYMPVAEIMNNTFYIYDYAQNDFKNRPALGTLGPLSPSTLYNGMINPLIPYTIKGAIWYQGESNVGRAEQYKTLFPDLIQNWRSKWNQGEFPFYFVQIAPYEYSSPENTESAEIREVQRLTMVKTPNTGMVVTLDIGNVKNIHPAFKIPVGERLAAWALANQYHKNIACSGPMYKSMSIEGNKVRLSFDYTGKGLSAKNGKLEGFEIAGADKQFVAAEAVIENNTVVVSSSKIAEPKVIRYAFKNGSQASLYNVDGLPASSFITE